MNKDTVRYIQKAVCELETQADRVYAASLNDYLIDKVQDKKPLLLTVQGECIVPPFRRAGPVENIGINNTIATYLADKDSLHNASCLYCAFVRSFGRTVLGISDGLYNDIIARQLQQQQVLTIASLSTTSLQEVLTQFLLITPGIPDDPYEQLQMAIEAMYRPWMPSPSAGASIEDCSLQERSMEAAAGIAVRVQQAVHGSGVSACGCGKVHTDPSSALDVVNYTLQYLPTAEVSPFRTYHTGTHIVVSYCRRQSWLWQWRSTVPQYWIRRGSLRSIQSWLWQWATWW